MTVNVRAGRDFTLVGGTSTGQTVADSCDVRARLPELATTTTGTSAFGAGLTDSAVTPLSPYCHVAFGVLTQVPRAVVVHRPEDRRSAGGDVSEQARGDAGGKLRGAELRTWRPRSGRNLSGNAANVTVNLVAPGTMYGDRINQLDLRIGQDPEVRPLANAARASRSTTR